MAEDDTAVPFRIPTDTTSREFVAQHISPNVASIIPPKIRHKFAVCAIQHPLDPSCANSKLTLFRDAFGRALKLYVPLNVVSGINTDRQGGSHTLTFAFLHWLIDYDPCF
jgi:hypothetical protein